MFAIVATVSLVVTGDNVFPTDFKKLPLVLYDDSSRKRDLAWRSRDAFSMRITRPVYGIYYPTWVGGQVKDILEVILEVDDGSIFSKNNLYLIQQIENLLFNFKDYKSTYCQRDELYECVKPWSIIRLFDGTYKSVDSSFYNLIQQTFYVMPRNSRKQRNLWSICFPKDMIPVSPELLPL